MKWFFGLTAAVVVLIIAAIVIIPFVVDPNDYKEEILSQVKSATGRDLSIRDGIELSVFPSLAVRLGGVALSNASGFQAKQMAAVEELDLKVALMPLLSGNLEVDTVVLRGLELHLAKDKSGKTNWDDLTGANKDAAPTSGPAASSQQLVVNIQGIIIDNAKLLWDDQQAGQSYQLHNVNIETGAIASGKTVPVTLGLLLKSAAPEQTFNLELSVSITTNDEFSYFHLAALAAQLTATGDGLPGSGLELEVKTDIELDNGAGTVEVRDFALTGPNVELTGALNGKGLNATPSFEGSFKLAESDLKQLMALGGSATVTADSKALTSVSAEFGVQASNKHAALKPFTVKLDDSTFTGDFSITSFDGPALRFALNLDQIDLDRYLPPQTEGENAATATQSASAPEPDDDPLSALRSLDLAGRVQVGKLKVANLRTTNIAVDIEAAGGVLSLSPIAADLYEGKVVGSIRLDARQKTPQIDIKNALQGIQINPLLNDLSGIENLAGQGSVNIELKMRGLDAGAIKQSLNGHVDVSLNDGTYRGVDVIKTICSIGGELDNLLKGATGELDQSGNTQFSAMSATIILTDGVARNNDLTVKSPLLRVSGKGSVHLPQDTIDYLVDAELVKACQGQSGAAAEQLVGVPLPIRVKGPLEQPKISPDWAALSQKLAGSELTDKAESLLKDKLNIPGASGDKDTAAGPAKDISDGLKEGLKGFF